MIPEIIPPRDDWPALFCANPLKSTDRVKVSHGLPTHFTDVKTVAQTKEETCSKAHSASVVEVGWDPVPDSRLDVPSAGHSSGPCKKVWF